LATYSVNKVILIGNLTRDPELRYIPQGAAVCTFGLATNRSWTTPDGETREDVEFHNIVAWRKLAEICNQVLSKGRKVYVCGRLQTRDWTGDDGVKTYKTEVAIDEMIALSSASAGSGSKSAQRSTTQTVEPNEQKSAEVIKTAKDAPKDIKDTKDAKEEVNPDDIPF
jgi:single-strand DNA-binding protein